MKVSRLGGILLGAGELFTRLSTRIPLNRKNLADRS